MITKIQNGTDSVHQLMLQSHEETQKAVSLSEEATKEVAQIEAAMIDIQKLSASLKAKLEMFDFNDMHWDSEIRDNKQPQAKKEHNTQEADKIGEVELF